MEYDNTNSGVLFKNDRKETERHPDYTGTWTDANGVEHWFSAWIKDSKSGTKFMSVSARPKNDQPAPSHAITLLTLMTKIYPFDG